MKKEYTFLFTVFTMLNVYSQVGVNTNEPTATLDINGSLRFREGTTQYATQGISTIIGTDDTDGNVFPNKVAENGLISSSGDLKVLPNNKGGVVVDDEGVAIKYSDALIVTDDKLSIVPNYGLGLSSDNLEVVPKSDGGIIVDGNGVGVRVADGLIIGGDGVTVQPKIQGGLVVDEDGVAINSGEAIIADEKGLNVNYDDGLTLNNANQLIVDMDYINGQNNNTIGSIGKGLQYKRVENSNVVDYLVSVESGNGISVSTTGVAVKAGNGITTDSDNIAVKAGNGITTDSDNIAVKAGNGITVSSTGVAVRAGDAITVTNGLVNVKAGNGAEIYNDKVSVNTGIGIKINDEEEVDIKLDPNSSMKLEPSYGLKLQTHPDGGLRIQNDSNGESRLRIALDLNSGLKIGSQVNTTVPYSPIGVNVNTNKGLNVDSNGVYVKLGDGLSFGSNGSINAENNSVGTIVGAKNGLSLSGSNVILGGSLDTPTKIVTSPTNTLALDGLISSSSSNYKLLTLNKNNGKIQLTDKPVVPSSSPLPFIITLGRDLVFNVTSAYPWDYKTTGWIESISNIPGIVLTNDNPNYTNGGLNHSTVSFPTGVYKVTITMQIETTGNYPCTLSSYFSGFLNGADRTASVNMPHIEGTPSTPLAYGGTLSYTLVITNNNTVLPIDFGATQNVNCSKEEIDNSNVILREKGTQIVIYKM